MKRLLVAIVFGLMIAQGTQAAEAGFAGQIGSMYTNPPQFGGHYVYHVSGVEGNVHYPYWLGQMRAPAYFYGASSCGGYSRGIQSHHHQNGRPRPLELLTGNRCQSRYAVIW